MNLKWYYWYFQSAIPPKICDDILEYGNALKKERARTGDGDNTSPTKDDLDFLDKKRKSDIAWFSDPWIYKEIQPYVHQANENAGWNFQWDWSEPFQFTEYKKGQFYDWHTDSSVGPYNNPNEPHRNGKIRKLSVITTLTDPDEFEGGELEFDFKNNDPQFEDPQPTVCSEIKARGSVVVFPSFMWHRVKPVTKGLRHSLVSWNLGNPFV